MKKDGDIYVWRIDFEVRIELPALKSQIQQSPSKRLDMTSNPTLQSKLKAAVAFFSFFFLIGKFLSLIANELNKDIDEATKTFSNRNPEC